MKINKHKIHYWVKPIFTFMIISIFNQGYASSAESSFRSNYKNESRVEGFIVKYHDNVIKSTSADIHTKQLNKRKGLETKLKYKRAMTSGSHVLKFKERVSYNEAKKIAKELAKDASVLYVEPDVRMYSQFTPNDTDYYQQWNLVDSTVGINIEDAWDLSTGENVVVAVIDTGVLPHTDLIGRILPGYDFIADVENANDGDGRDNNATDPGDWFWTNGFSCSPQEPSANSQGNQDGPDSSVPPFRRIHSSWHGTHVTGTIAAATNNSQGVAGIAFDAKILPVRVLGQCGGLLSDIVDGMAWAAGLPVPGVPNNQNPAQILNLSLAGIDSCSQSYQDVITVIREQNTTIIVAAGNSNSDASSTQPANCDGVITVAATDRIGNKAHYSNYGNAVDIAAPGGDTSASTVDGILSTLNNGFTIPGDDTYQYYQGTSMATPHVAGVAALLYSLNPTLSPDDISDILTSTASEFPGECDQCGAGLVNAAAAVNQVELFQTSTTPWLESIITHILL